MKAAQSKLLAGIRAGRLSAVESAIQAPANVWTLILSAIRIADAKIVAMLLQAGADLSLRVSKNHDNRSVAGKTVREIAQESSKAVRALISRFQLERTVR